MTHPADQRRAELVEPSHLRTRAMTPKQAMTREEADRPVATIGWARPSNSLKHHAFGPDKRSLCAKWMFMGELDFVEADKASTDDCATCRKRYDTRHISALRESKP